MSPAPSQQILRLPGAVARVLGPLPLVPLEIALQRLLAGILKHHPALVERLAAAESKRVAIAPIDLPFVIVLEMGNASIALRLARSQGLAGADACISGPLLALMGLVEGIYDGDALFFSRDLLIEGDIEAVLALRNAIDDADIDLLREAAACVGGPAVPLAHAARSFIIALRRNLGYRPFPHQEEVS